MKKQKRNNKGFSMVELIIVIAIMAVLTAVTAPQYLKYVEKSRVSADENTIDDFKTALNVMITDEDTPLPVDTYTVEITKDNVTAKAADDTHSDELAADLSEFLGANNTAAKLKSKTYSKGYKFTITVSATVAPTVTGAKNP